jgi:hypothetical protein
MAAVGRKVLEQYMAKVKMMPVNEQVRFYVAIRERKAALTKAYKEEHSEFDQLMDCAAGHLLAHTIQQKITGFKSEFGTVYTTEEVKLSIADPVLFNDFVIAEGDISFLQARPSQQAVADYMKANDNKVPLGLSIFRENVARVRKPGEKE